MKPALCIALLLLAGCVDEPRGGGPDADVATTHTAGATGTTGEDLNPCRPVGPPEYVQVVESMRAELENRVAEALGGSPDHVQLVTSEGGVLRQIHVDGNTTWDNEPEALRADVEAYGQRFGVTLDVTLDAPNGPTQSFWAHQVVGNERVHVMSASVTGGQAASHIEGAVGPFWDLDEPRFERPAALDAARTAWECHSDGDPEISMTLAVEDWVLVWAIEYVIPNDGHCGGERWSAAIYAHSGRLARFDETPCI